MSRNRRIPGSYEETDAGMFSSNDTGFRDKVFLIPGGSKGIGEDSALEIVKLGGKVVIAGRNADAVHSTVGRLRSHCASPQDVLGLQTDLTSLKQIRAMVDSAYEHFGRINVLINSAGTNIRTAALDVTESEWDAVMDVNLKGAFFTAQAFARTIPQDRRGKIINISSQYGYAGSPTRVVYCASKGGLELMTKSLAVEWAPRIQVNSVCPTFIETDLTRSMLTDPETGPPLLGRIPMQRFGRVQDVTGAVLYLASGYAELVTGSAIMVDGGWTAG